MENKEKSLYLYEFALEVEKDEALNSEMEDWDVTIGDGIDLEL
jgi:hypothetical protein